MSDLHHPRPKQRRSILALAVLGLVTAQATSFLVFYSGAGLVFLVAAAFDVEVQAPDPIALAAWLLGTAAIAILGFMALRRNRSAANLLELIALFWLVFTVLDAVDHALTWEHISPAHLLYAASALALASAARSVSRCSKASSLNQLEIR